MITQARKIAKLVKCLLWNDEDLSSVPRTDTHEKIPGLVTDAYNSNAEEAGQRDPGCTLSRQPRWIGESQDSEKPWLKKQGGWHLSREPKVYF